MRPISQALGRGKSRAVRRNFAAANRRENVRAAPTLPHDIKKKSPKIKNFRALVFAEILSATLRLFGGIGGNLPDPRGDRLLRAADRSRRQKGGGEHCQKFLAPHLRPIYTIFRKSPRSRPPRASPCRLQRGSPSSPSHFRQTYGSPRELSNSPTSSGCPLRTPSANSRGRR